MTFKFSDEELGAIAAAASQGGITLRIDSESGKITDISDPQKLLKMPMSKLKGMGFSDLFPTGQTAQEAIVRARKEPAPLNAQLGSDPERVLVGTLMSVADGAEVLFLGTVHSHGRAMSSPLEMQVDPEGRILGASPALLELLGCGSTDLVGQDFDAIVHVPAGVQAPDLRNLEATGCWYGDLGLKVPDTVALAWLRVSISTEPTSDGTPCAFVVTGTDITDLHQTNRSLNDIIGALNQTSARIEFTPDGEILDANQIFLDLMGYDLSEITGKHHSMFCRPEEVDTPQYRQHWKDLAAGKSQTDFYVRCRKDGELVRLRASYNAIHGADGSIQKIVKIGMDTTNVWKSGRDMKSRVNAIESILCIFEFDIDGKILRINDRFCKLTGRSNEEVVGKKLEDLCPPETARSMTFTKMWERFRKGQGLGGELRLTNKEGNVLHVHVEYSVIPDVYGNPSRIVAYSRDITEEKERSADYESKINAISRAQAMIEFDLDGHVLSA
ncbi:MAG: PAS domain-containing protein, partial [Pseudomonadota bacterium]|nr:PAS domain-containing protein [Pseudomonadota bacterium]